MNHYAVGIDFGGTNTKLGVMHRSGRILAESSFPTAACPRPLSFAKKIAQEVEVLLESSKVARHDVVGVGIGVPGLVDSERGIIHTLVNVPGWDGVPLASLARHHLKLNCWLENDVNAMALGEARYGAARHYENAVCVTLGTGVGGGLILDGHLYRGATLTAGEIGHIVVEPKGPQCECGGKGCLEALIGTKGLLRLARVLLKKSTPGKSKGLVGSRQRLTPLSLAKAAKDGDRIALQVWTEAARYLGIVFAGITNLINPDIFVVGGGISGVGSFFF